MEWNEYFMGIAESAALKSKDPSTKLGAVIVSDDHQILSIGFNGFPRGVADTEERYSDRQVKYKFVEHAERNAIHAAARHGVRLKGATLYCAWYPCSECTKAIIQAGIRTICIGNTTIPERWLADMRYSEQMLTEADVDVINRYNLPARSISRYTCEG